MFHSARLKLTVWYLLIIMFISLAFSATIYRILTNEVERFAGMQRHRIENRLQNLNLPPPPIISDPDLIIEVRQRVLLMLAEINFFIFVVSGALGYFLAGQTLRPIAQMVDEQNRFISDASHELRTPLTALKTSMEVNLRDKELTLDQAKKIIRGSIDQVNKLSSLSNSLLELAQYQVNNHKFFKAIFLKKIVDEVVKKLTPLAEKKQIVIKRKIIEAKINANQESLSNLFTILLDNAIKYSPANSQITVSSKRVDKSIFISIKDQGMGIDKKDLPHIFDRFYRADSARSKADRGGYGLGLSIAKKIVEIHQGAITVDSQINKGTVFTIKFPFS